MTDLNLSHIRIVLVEPAGPLNVGAIARVMKNMGLYRLVWVNPQCDPMGDDARQMAVHAVDVLEAAQSAQTLPEALQGCQRAIATTARDRALETVLETPRTGLPWLLGDLDPQQNRFLPVEAALIFGPEERGLSNVELNYAQRFVRIPSSDTYPSLNLAQAVAVCCYELYQLSQEAIAPPSVVELAGQAQNSAAYPLPPAPDEIAPMEVLEGFYQQLEALLLEIGYLYPHTASSRMEKFRRLFGRASLSNPEVSMLRGILRQMAWALHTDLKPDQKSELE